MSKWRQSRAGLIKHIRAGLESRVPAIIMLCYYWTIEAVSGLGTRPIQSLIVANNGSSLNVLELVILVHMYRYKGSRLDSITK